MPIDATLSISSDVLSLFEHVKNLQSSLTPDTLGHPARVNIWLLALLRQNKGCLKGLVETNPDELTKDLERQVSDKGLIGYPLSIDEAVNSAYEIACQNGSKKITVRFISLAVLQRSNLQYNSQALSTTSEDSSNSIDSSSNTDEVADIRPIPTLLQYGRDLTREARNGKLSPTVGRDRELELMIETLCRRTKRNPVLVGPAGVGKTAIVEGLARKIAQGDVPKILKGITLVHRRPLITNSKRYEI